MESRSDVVVARRKGRSMAAEIGFDPRDLTRITAAISELAGNTIPGEHADVSANYHR